MYKADFIKMISVFYCKKYYLNQYQGIESSKEHKNTFRYDICTTFKTFVNNNNI